jgi:hypothetical protein
VTSIENVSLYENHEIIFQISPHAVFESTTRRNSIVINSENIVLECEGSIIDVKGTHLAFGSNAKNVLVRGLTFQSATFSSLTVFHNGAEAIFQDCTLINSSGAQANFGSVSNANSSHVSARDLIVGFLWNIPSHLLLQQYFSAAWV